MDRSDIWLQAERCTTIPRSRLTACLILCCFLTGDEAVLAKNVFYYLTYEGSVDLDAIEDVVTRRVMVL